MGLESILRRAIFGRSGGGAKPAASGLHEAMAAELRRLDLYRRGLGAEAIRFVAGGEGSGVVADIEACRKAVPIYTAPFHQDGAGRLLAELATNTALATGGIAPGPEVGRMMAVRHAVGAFFTKAPLSQVPPEKVPVQALCAAIGAGVEATQENYITRWERLVPLPQLLKLIQSAGGTVADLFGFVLERYSAFLTPGSWQASEAFADYARTYPTAFAQALLALEPHRRASAIRLAEHHQVQAAPEILAPLVVLLNRPYEKADRELAISTLARVEGTVLAELIADRLAGADIETRFGLVQAAGRNGAPELIALLGERAAVEKAAKVKAAIAAVLEARAPATAQHDAPGYTGIDGRFVALPPRVEIVAEEAPPATPEERAGFDACIAEISAHRAEMLAKQTPGDRNDRNHHYRPPTAEQIEATFALMTRGEPQSPQLTGMLSYDLRSRESGRTWYMGVLERLPLEAALRSLLAASYEVVGKLLGANSYVEPQSRATLETLRGWIEAGRLGVRELIAVELDVAADRACAAGQDAPAGDVGAHLRTLLAPAGYSYERGPYRSPLRQLPANAVWPWLVDAMHVFDEALGLQPAARPLDLDRALATLELLPAAPQRYLPRLIEIAVAEKKPLRRRAMALLRGATDLEQRIAALLDDSRQQVRANAATWLADIRAAGGEASLRKRLKKEKSPPVRTALVEALQRLGADLSDLIGPASLIAEAEKAGEKAAPELPAWIGGGALPAVRFRDGAPLPEPVLRHWLALAIRLKEPGATGQFGLYLDQLDPADARALSAWVLESWIAYDTQSVSLDEANAYALENYASQWLWHRGPQTAELREELIAELRQQRLGELPNSGTDSKGVLALACRAEPAWAAGRVRWYLKKHGRRSHQAMALLDVLAGIGAPATLQVVIAASARLKQKSTQAHAAEIAARYAEDRGWSFDELADRTVPAAGFDDDGVLELPCGEEGKLYTARLDAMLAIHLFNPEGKPVKALPAGGDEATRESAKALLAAKKELKQVIDLQAARLFEAMCVERSWPAADWRSAFHEHPVMRRLVERLVWQGIDAEGQPQGLFRPTQEGDFTDVADGAVDLDGFARLRLAHGALVDAATCAAWIAHLADYEITPFLAQFDTVRAPLTPEEAEASAIADRTGWVAPSLTYRGIIEKRGYQRVMGDGGGCSEYAKSFPSHGITATIHHSGSYAEDENNPVALKQLSFAKAGRHGPFRLKDVPPVMLAECRADYHALAAKGAYREDWEKVAAW